MSPTAPDDLPQWLAPLSAAAAAITDGDSDWLGWRPRVRTLAGEPRQSAVLILFAEGGPGGTPGRPDVLLTERAATLRSHAGQPAFPGGRIDPGDQGPVGAALREAEEETGVDPAAVAVFGHLPELYLQPSDFMVASVLGWWRTPAPLRIGSPSEVAIVRRVPVDELSDPANRFRLRHPTGYVGSAFTAGGMLVWGFTAGLLDAVLRLGGWEREWDRTRIRELPAEMSASAFPPGPAAGSSTMSPAEQRPYMQEPIGLRKPRGSA